MKRSVLKLLGAALALCLILSGCNMIKVDEVMQIKEDMKALEQQESKVLVEYDGGQITRGEVGYEYAYQVNYANMIYSSYGMTFDESALATLQENVLNSAMNTRATVLKAEELGITLSEDELAECQTTADETYQEQYDEYFEEHATGKTDDIKAMETEFALRQSGLTREVLLNTEKASKLVEKVQEQVRGEVTEVTEEEVQSAFELKAAEDEAKYESDPSSFETDIASTDVTPYWYPAGYRTVKHILLVPEQSLLDAVSEKQTTVDDIQSNLDSLNKELESLTAPAEETEETEEAAEGEETEEAAETEEATEDTAAAQAKLEEDIAAANAELEAAQAELDEAKAAAIASVQDKIDDIYSRLEAGEEFQTLIDEYGEDPGMQNEPAATQGYYVSDRTTSLDPAFKEAAMALENIGDVSEPTLGSYGVHIIRYETDVPDGNIDIETVREQLTEDTLEKARDDYYDEQLKGWVDALKPVFHAENWN